MARRNEASEQRVLERGLVRVRWFAVAFGLFQVWQLSSTLPTPPRYVVPWSYVSIAVLAAGNGIISRLSSRATSPAAMRRIGLAAYALDTAVIFANVWIGSYDRNATGWTLAYILPLEGAIRYQYRGAAASIGLFSVSELAREFFRMSLFKDLRFAVSSVTFRVGIFAIIAVVAGMMARNLRRQREAAEAHADELARLADTNERLLAQERATVERLRELDMMKSDFVAVTSHELRTPLTAVQGFVKTLRREDVSLSSAEARDFLAIVDRQTERLARLVEDLLLTARIEAGAIDLHMDSVDMATLIAETIDEVSPAQHRVRLAIEPGMPRVLTDAHRVDQIARNLIENAIKFSAEDQAVRVTVLNDAGSIVIEVADHGRGIPAEDLPKIFDRFRQVGDSLHRRSRGLGLGLYIVSNLVDALNGSVAVHSVVGEGTVFTVRLPLVLEASRAEGA